MRAAPEDAIRFSEIVNQLKYRDGWRFRSEVNTSLIEGPTVFVSVEFRTTDVDLEEYDRRHEGLPLVKDPQVRLFDQFTTDSGWPLSYMLRRLWKGIEGIEAHERMHFLRVAGRELFPAHGETGGAFLTEPLGFEADPEVLRTVAPYLEPAVPR